MIDKFVQGPDLIGAEVIAVGGTPDEYHTLTIKLKTGEMAEIDAENGYPYSLLCFTKKIYTEEEKKEEAEARKEREKWSLCYRKANGNLKKAKVLFNEQDRHTKQKESEKE